MAEPRVDVLLVDDHPLLSEGLRGYLAARGVEARVAENISTASVLNLVDDLRPRLVILDYSIPEIGVSTSLVEPIRMLGSQVVMLTGTKDPALWGSLIEVGAVGVMGKEEPLGQLLDGIELALRGEPFRPGRAAEYREAWLRHRLEEQAQVAPFRLLSARETEVAAALVRGDSPADIAAASFVAVGTVRSQLKSIYRKLEVSSQLELVTMARRASWSGSSDSDEAIDKP